MVTVREYVECFLGFGLSIITWKRIRWQNSSQCLKMVMRKRPRLSLDFSDQDGYHACSWMMLEALHQFNSDLRLCETGRIWIKTFKMGQTYMVQAFEKRWLPRGNERHWWQHNDLLIEATQVCCEWCILQQTFSLRLWQWYRAVPDCDLRWKYMAFSFAKL